MIKSKIIAENGNWRIRQAEDDNYAFTCAEGHFTFYIKSKNEKLVFYNALKSVEAKMKEVAFITFGGWFALWLTREDVAFLLVNLPMSDAEKQASINAEIMDEKITIQ